MNLFVFVRWSICSGLGWSVWTGQAGHFGPALGGQFHRLFQHAGKLKAGKERTHQSVALQLTEERLEKMNGGELMNSIIIHDLIDENGNATGTRVEMNVPVENTL